MRTTHAQGLGGILSDCTVSNPGKACGRLHGLTLVTWSTPMPAPLHVSCCFPSCVLLLPFMCPVAPCASKQKVAWATLERCCSSTQTPEGPMHTTRTPTRYPAALPVCGYATKATENPATPTSPPQLRLCLPMLPRQRTQSAQAFQARTLKPEPPLLR